jgi:hypothetical protein
VKSAIKESYLKKKLRLRKLGLNTLSWTYNFFFGKRFDLKLLANGKYVFLFRVGRFSDWVAIDMRQPEYAWKVGSSHFKDCMFDVSELPKLKHACSVKFAMSGEEFDALIFKLVKEDIVNEDSN